MHMKKFLMEKVNEEQWNVSCKTSMIDASEVVSRDLKDHEIEKILSRIDFNYHQNIFIFGIRGTQLIEEIYKRKSQFSTITIFEIFGGVELEITASELFPKLLNDPTVDVYIDKLDVLLVRAFKAIKSGLRNFNIYNMRILTMPYVKSRQSEDLQRLINGLFDELVYLTGVYGNSVEDILLGSDNFMNNIDYFIDGMHAQDFENEYKNKPAIIVGAGPSLEKNIHVLEKHKDKALIFSVDAAYKTLLNHNIVPDAVTTVERTDITYKFYKEIDKSSDTVFVGPHLIKGGVLDKFEKRIDTGRYGDTILREMMSAFGLESLKIGMNVANAPFAFARHMGCNPIIFAGLDLAYTSGKTHVSNITDNMDASIRKFYEESTTYVRGQNGEFLETYEFFNYARLWFEKNIHLDKSTVYINATEGGANINGMINMPLEDVFSKVIKDDVVTAKLTDVYDRIKSEHPDFGKDVPKQGRAFIESVKSDFESFIKLIEEGKKEIEKKKAKDRVRKIVNQRFEIDSFYDQHLVLRFMVQPIYMSYNRKMQSFPILLNKEKEAEFLSLALDYYGTLIEVSKKIIETLGIYADIYTSHSKGLPEGENTSEVK